MRAASGLLISDREERMATPRIREQTLELGAAVRQWILAAGPRILLKLLAKEPSRLLLPKVTVDGVKQPLQGQQEPLKEMRERGVQIMPRKRMGVVGIET